MIFRIGHSPGLPIAFSKKASEGGKKSEASVTIAAAAICQFSKSRDGKSSPVVVAIADRMLSSADVEFEPDVPKIKELSAGVVCLYAGDRDAHYAIFEKTRRVIGGKCTVEEVADRYAGQYMTLRRKRAESKYLTPFGIGYEEFFSKVSDKNSTLAVDIAQKIYSERLGIQAIIAGTDDTGAHLYSVGKDEDGGILPVCHDDRGFVAIGAGFRQFEIECMRVGFTSQYQWVKALWMMMVAKLRAEVSPGVGQKTDAVLVIDSVPYFREQEINEIISGLRGHEAQVKKTRDIEIEKMIVRYFELMEASDDGNKS